MDERIEVSRQMLINIHNAVAQMHPTGDDIITAAAVLMDLRKLLQEEQEEEKHG